MILVLVKATPTRNVRTLYGAKSEKGAAAPSDPQAIAIAISAERSACSRAPSAFCWASHSKKPLFAAERMPLRLRLVSLNKDFPMVKVQASSAEMQALAQDFVQFAVDSGVLRFGEFKTKAGRMSPYFFNAGLFDDGAKLGRLAAFFFLYVTEGIPLGFAATAVATRSASSRWGRYSSRARPIEALRCTTSPDSSPMAPSTS